MDASVELAATLDSVVDANTTNAEVLVADALAVIMYHPLVRIEGVILIDDVLEMEDLMEMQSDEDTEGSEEEIGAQVTE